MLNTFSLNLPRVCELIFLCFNVCARIMRSIQAIIRRFFATNCQSYRLFWHRTASTPGMLSGSSAENSYNIPHNSPRVCVFFCYFCSVRARTMPSVQGIIRRFSRRIARVVAWFVTEPRPHQEWFQVFQLKFLIFFSISRRVFAIFFLFFSRRELMDYAINPSYHSPFFTTNCRRCGLFGPEQCQHLK